MTDAGWTQTPEKWTPKSEKIDASALSTVILGGDLSKLTAEQRVQYYSKICVLVGLNPLTKPFDYIVLNGKTVLYANKGCAEQLRAIYKIGLKIKEAKRDGDLYVVVVEAIDPAGRTDSGLGAVPCGTLKGEPLANAMMKAETKAKRRATLSICGLNMLDESEVESVPRVAPQQPEPGDGFERDEGYRIPFGQWARLSIEEVYEKHGPKKIASYIDYLHASAEKKNTPITPDGPVGDFIKRAEDYCGARENCSIENGEQNYDEPGMHG